MYRFTLSQTRKKVITKTMKRTADPRQPLKISNTPVTTGQAAEMRPHKSNGVKNQLPSIQRELTGAPPTSSAHSCSRFPPSKLTKTM
jgi:hypothetical protein